MTRSKDTEIDPKDQLLLYLDRAERLTKTRLARSTFDCGVSISMSNLPNTPSFSTSSREPDNDDLISFLVVFRQFFNNDEPIFQNKIFKLLYLCLTSEELRNYLQLSREAWKTALTKAGININYTLKTKNGSVLIDRKDLTPEFVTDLWINEAVHSYARSREKQLLLKYMLPHERMLTRASMLQFIYVASNEIMNTRFIITAALRGGHLDFTKARR